MISIGKFISAAPAHPLTLAGYLLGGIAMLIFISQIFKWNIPVINNPAIALYVLAGCIITKGIIGRFSQPCGCQIIYAYRFVKQKRRKSCVACF